jgi:hypothetical protein
MVGPFFLGSIFGWIVALAGLAAVRSISPSVAAVKVGGLTLLFAGFAFGGGWYFLDWKGGVTAVTGMAAGAVISGLIWTAWSGRAGYSGRRGR